MQDTCETINQVKSGDALMPAGAARRAGRVTFAAVQVSRRSTTVQCIRLSGAVSGKRAKALLRVLLDGQAQEKHLRALHSVVVSCRLFSVASHATSEAAATLLFLPELPPKDDEKLEHEPDFLATLDGQRSELVCSL